MPVKVILRERISAVRPSLVVNGVDVRPSPWRRCTCEVSTTQEGLVMSRQREEFQQRVEELVAGFEAEVDRSEWVTRRYPKRMRDDARQLYEVPALYLQKGPTSLLLDPIGNDVPGAEGAADLYLMPTYDPTASVYFEDGRWVIHYEFPLDPSEPHTIIEAQVLPLSAQTINQVLNSIAEHAVPSV
jgi:hypothetical protein